LLLIAAKRSNVWFALSAGAVLGVACWFRVNPLYLCVFWAIAIFLFVRGPRKHRILLGATVVTGTLLVISPIVLRNYLTFPDFTPTGGTIGINLWEGLGETDLGRRNGFVLGDQKMLEIERRRMGLPEDAVLKAQWPDGIRRDKERTRQSLSFIKQHPVWYAGVMLRRMWGTLKVAGAPLPYYGSSGINVTSKKCLPQNWQGGVVAVYVNALGMFQSVVRYLLLLADSSRRLFCIPARSDGHWNSSDDGVLLPGAWHCGASGISIYAADACSVVGVCGNWNSAVVAEWKAGSWKGGCRIGPIPLEKIQRAVRRKTNFRSTPARDDGAYLPDSVSGRTIALVARWATAHHLPIR
jgi:hypothetical protein